MFHVHIVSPRKIIEITRHAQAMMNIGSSRIIKFFFSIFDEAQRLSQPHSVKCTNELHNIELRTVPNTRNELKISTLSAVH